MSAWATEVGDRPPGLDDSQARAVAFRGPLLRVLGGPGTGKTTVAVEIVADRVTRGEVDAGECIVLAATRRSAASTRSMVTSRLARTTVEPMARTFSSLGFGILRRAAALFDEPPPTLLAGPEQDVILGELLAGHREGSAPGPPWPHHLRDALATKGFRSELRDLLMRAVEHGLDADRLADLGRAHDRGEWIAAADVLREYDEVTALSRPGAFDPAWIQTAAADALDRHPELLASVTDELRLVVVDDAHEVTAPAARLLRILGRAGSWVVLLGDPDSAVQTFRGADVRFLADGWTDVIARAGQRSAVTPTTIVLERGHRLPAAIATGAARIAQLVGAAGGGRQRAALPPHGAGTLEVNVFRSAAQEAAYVADQLRRAHLLDGMPWRDMAVIVRGRGRSGTVRRVLAAADIPVSETGSDLPIGAEAAVAPLLTIFSLALTDAERDTDDSRQPPDNEVAVDLLCSPFGGADAVTLRRLRRALRRAALADGAALPADRLLAEALLWPGRLLDLGSDAAGARRIARMLTAGSAALRGGSDVESVLWAIWSASGVADEWRRVALAGGRAGARADRDLDAVVAIFGAASAFVERLPHIGPRAFLDHIRSQEVAADSLVPRSPSGASVALLTPHAAAGRQWPLVAVIGVQEGAWPDLRLRGSLLGSAALVDLLTDRDTSIRGAATAVRHDEARLFLVAVSRARQRLLVSAVRTEDEQPSPYLDIIDPRDQDRGRDRPFTEVDRPLSLVGVVGGLRRRLLEGLDGADADRAASALAALAGSGVRGADPRTWWGMRDVSDLRPRSPAAARVRVSPSSLDTFGNCEVRWLFDTLGGTGPPVGAAAVGSLVHEIIAEVDDDDAETMIGLLRDRWSRLGLSPGWIDRSKYREARHMLRQAARYGRHAEASGWTRVAAEVPISTEVGRADLVGTVDRLERNADGAIRVIDYKTGSSKPKVREVATHPQLGAYQLAVQEGALRPHGTASAGAALVQLGKATTTDIAKAIQLQPALSESSDPEWARRLVVDAADTMGGFGFRATISDLCRTCPVRTSCPAQPEGGSLA